MYIGICNEALCTQCSHQEVCSLKDQFIAAQKTVDDVSVTLGRDGKSGSFKRLRDFNWIERVKLKCVYFSPKKRTRQDISETNQIFN